MVYTSLYIDSCEHKHLCYHVASLFLERSNFLLPSLLKKEKKSVKHLAIIRL